VLLGSHNGLLEPFTAVGGHGREQADSRWILRRMSQVAVVERGEHPGLNTASDVRSRLLELPTSADVRFQKGITETPAVQEPRAAGRVRHREVRRAGRLVGLGGRLVDEIAGVDWKRLAADLERKVVRNGAVEGLTA
jgi:hypothetical protein